MNIKTITQREKQKKSGLIKYKLGGNTLIELTAVRPKTNNNSTDIMKKIKKTKCSFPYIENLKLKDINIV